MGRVTIVLHPVSDSCSCTAGYYGASAAMTAATCSGERARAPTLIVPYITCSFPQARAPGASGQLPARLSAATAMRGTM